MHRLYANTTPSYMRDLIIPWFCCQKSWLPVHQCQIERQSLEEQKTVALLFLPGKRNTQTMPCSLGNRERFLYPHEGLAFFFLLWSFKTATAATRQLSNQVWCPWSYWPVTFLKCRMLHERVGGEESQVQSTIHTESESNQLCLALWRVNPATSVCQ